MSIVDQGIYSGSNFVISVLLARWLTTEEFGAYAIALAIFQFGWQFQNAMIIEPMSVIGPAYHTVFLTNFLVGQLKIHFMILIPMGIALIGGAWGFVLWGGDILVGRTVFVLGIFMTFMLIPWLTRRIFYILEKPRISAIGSLIYSVCLIALILAFKVLGWLSPEMGLVALAMSSVISSIYIWRRLASMRKQKKPMDILNIFKENWSYSKWRAPASLLVAIAGQAQLFMVGNLVGLEGAGVLRVAQNLIQPMLLIIASLGALNLPKMAKDYGKRNLPPLLRRAVKLVAMFCSIAFSYAFFIFIFRTHIEEFLFAGKYEPYVNIFAAWTLIPILISLYSGFLYFLQAVQKPEAILINASVWAPFSVISAYVLTFKFGIKGSTLSACIGHLLSFVIYGTIFMVWIRNNKIHKKTLHNLLL